MRYCQLCSGELHFGAVPGESRHRYHCRRCGFIHYLNPRPVVATIPERDGQIYLIRRGIEPGYGLWSYPGGFLELDETAEEGARRETLEETGLEVAVGEPVGVFSRPEAGIITIVYRARVIGGQPRLSAETLGVRAFQPDKIPWHELAFPTVRAALRRWMTGAAQGRASG